MDNLKTLFKKQNYQLIIDLTKDSFDYESISYRLSSFIALNKFEEACAIFNNEVCLNAIYNKNPKKCIEMHIELLLELKKYVEAIKQLNIYQDRPYVSQEVEELFRSYPNKIESLIKQENKKVNFTEENILNILNNEKDKTNLISTIYQLNKLDISPYLDSLIKLINQDIDNDIKVIVLALLVSKKVNKDLVYKRKDKIYKINPANLEVPFVNKKYLAINDNFSKISKNTSVIDIAKDLLNRYLLSIFPEKLDENVDVKIFTIAFLSLAKKYLKEEDISSFISSFNVDEVTINNLIKRIEDNLK